MNPSIYNPWFESVTGWAPHEWQAALGETAECDNRLIRVPTGMGKTEGVLAAWLYHSVGKRDPGWPLRLACCLPMRVLVEQTAERCRRVIERWAEVAGVSEDDRPRVHILMGGEDTDGWWLDPEQHAVLVGTQDILLSRALHRSYASGRARWPMKANKWHDDTCNTTAKKLELSAI